MTNKFDFTIVHIEDDASTWRENPSKILAMIRDLIDESSWPQLKITHPPDRYADVAVTLLQWPHNGVTKRAQFIFSTEIGIEKFANKLQEGGELTFIVDARRPGNGATLDLTLFDSFESIAPMVHDSRVQVRVFTAYMDVEDQLNGMKKVQKKKLPGFYHPVDVIPKIHALKLSTYLLDRLGFSS